MRCFTHVRAATVMLASILFATIAHADPPPERVKVTATIFPLADIVRQVGRNRVQVTALLPPGANPFTYRPTQLQKQQAAGSAIYIRVGSGLDPWGDGLFTGTGAKPLVITATDGGNLLLREESAADRRPLGAKGSVDPWVWLDPVFVRDRILPAVTAALVRLSPTDARFFKVNERKYFEELTKLDVTMRSVLRQLPGRGFVATHPVWGYLAKRYDLREAAVLNPSFDAAPSPQSLDSLAGNMLRLGISTVFGDPWCSAAAGRNFAARLHGSFVLLDPLGGELITGRHNYLALMHYNLALIKSGVK